MINISRRSLLSWLGASAAGTLVPLAAVPESLPQGRRSILSIESFRATGTDQMSRVRDYLAGALLPCLDKVHESPTMVLEAMVAPHLPQALLLTLFASFDEMLEIRGRIAAESSLRRARAGLESLEVPVQVQSQLLLTSEQCLRLPVGSDSIENGVFELRSYHAPAGPGFRPARLSAALARAGIHPIVNAASAAAEHLPPFTYLIPFESLTARHEAWARLDADAEWLDLQRESIAAHDSAVKVTEKSIYALAPYSRLA
jgi:hypothetical protein